MSEEKPRKMEWPRGDVAKHEWHPPLRFGAMTQGMPPNPEDFTVNICRATQLGVCPCGRVEWVEF